MTPLVTLLLAAPSGNGANQVCSGSGWGGWVWFWIIIGILVLIAIGFGGGSYYGGRRPPPGPRGPREIQT